MGCSCKSRSQLNKDDVMQSNEVMLQCEAVMLQLQYVLLAPQISPHCHAPVVSLFPAWQLHLGLVMMLPGQTLMSKHWATAKSCLYFLWWGNNPPLFCSFLAKLWGNCQTWLKITSESRGWEKRSVIPQKNSKEMVGYFPLNDGKRLDMPEHWLHCSVLLTQYFF